MIDELEHHGNGEYDQLYDQINQRHNCTTWSPTSVKTFLGCRLKYFFQYVKNWKITARSLDLAIGTAFHAAAEKLNRYEVTGQSFTPEDLFEEFDKSWHADLSEMKEGEHYKAEKEVEPARQKGLDIVEKHLNSRIRQSYVPAVYLPPYNSLMSPAVELKVDVPLVNIHTGKLYTDKHKVTGIIDLVSVAHKPTSHFDPGDLMVLDYKTTGREWDQFSVDTNLQILMYAYAIRFILRNENWFPHLKKDKEDLVGIICLIKQKDKDTNKWGKIKNYIIRITDDEIEYLERLLVKCINELESNQPIVKDFLPNPTPDNCRHCEYQEPCLLVRRGAKDKDIQAWGEKKGFF